MTENNEGNGKRVVVTGGAGFFGSHLCEEFLARGYEVTAIDNLKYGRWNFVPSDCKKIQADISSPVCCEAIAGATHVVHAAAEPFIPACYNSPGLFVNTNILGTTSVLDFCRAGMAVGFQRVLVISSSEVYGTAQTRPMTEEHRLNPQSTYATSKLAAERLAVNMFHEQGVPVVILRPFNMYGPRLVQNYVIPEIIAQAHRSADGRLSLGNVDSVRDFSYVADTAWVAAEILTKGKLGGTYHYGSGEPISIRRIVELVGEVLGKKLTIEIDPKKLRPHDVTHLEADSSKISWKIGKMRERTPFSVGLMRTVEWFIENGAKWPWEDRQAT